MCTGAGTGSGSTRFRRRFRRFRRKSGRLWCRARSGSTGFRRRFRRRLGGFGAEPGQVQQFRRRFRRRLGGFGAEPGQVQQVSGEGSGEPGEASGEGWEALVQSQVRFNSSGEGSGEGWEALVQSQVRFNRVPEKVPEKVCFGAKPEKVPGDFGAEPNQVQQGSEEGSREGLGGFGADPAQVSQGFGEGSGEGLGRLWCRARSGSMEESQVRFNKVPEKVCRALRETGRSGRCSLRPHPLCKDLSLDGEGINNCAEIMPQRKSNIKHDARCTRRSTCKFFTIKCSWVDVLHAVLPSSCGISPSPFAKLVKSCQGLKVFDGLWFPRNDFARKWKNSPKSFQEALAQSQVRFNGFRRRFRRWLGGFGAELGAEPGQVQQGSGEGSGEGLGGFGAEPGQVQQKVPGWCKAKSGSTGSGEGCRSQARSGSFSARKPS